MWHTDKQTEPTLYNLSQRVKDEEQWFTTKDRDGIELALSLVHEYDDEVIIGCVKTAGYLKNDDRITKLLTQVWGDLIKTFGHKTMICPSGSYLEYVHLCVNQKRIPHQPYAKKAMRKLGFKRKEYYWVRRGSNHKTN